MPMLPQRRKIATGFSLIEVVLSMIVVGVMFVAAMNTLGSAKVGQYKVAEKEKAVLLSHALMSEILQQFYWDPVAQTGMGPAPSESATGDRSLFNDVDDYKGWSASPPQHKDGTPIEGLDSTWQRSVDVFWVNPDDPSQRPGAESGAKTVIITVTHNGVIVDELIAYRTKAWDGIE